MELVKCNINFLLNNSMHVLVVHVPDYLRSVASVAPLKKFSQQGTELVVKELRRLYHHLLSRRDSATANVLKIMARRMQRRVVDCEGFDEIQIIEEVEQLENDLEAGLAVADLDDE